MVAYGITAEMIWGFQSHCIGLIHGCLIDGEDTLTKEVKLFAGLLAFRCITANSATTSPREQGTTSQKKSLSILVNESTEKQLSLIHI